MSVNNKVQLKLTSEQESWSRLEPEVRGICIYGGVDQGTRVIH
jgi:hypothetical protein